MNRPSAPPLLHIFIDVKMAPEPVEKTIIDRCIRLIHRDCLSNASPEKMLFEII